MNGELNAAGVSVFRETRSSKRVHPARLVVNLQSERLVQLLGQMKPSIPSRQL